MTSPHKDVAIVGIDLSLAATGIAHADGSTTTVLTRKLAGPARLIEVRDAVTAALDVRDWAPDLVLIEGYAYGRPAQAHQVGELGGVVRVVLHERCIAFPYMGWAVVAPAKLKKFATGKGTADKTAMVVAARERLGFGGLDDNQADAMWLRALGLAMYQALPVRLPQAQLVAMDTIEILHGPEGPAL